MKGRSLVFPRYLGYGTLMRDSCKSIGGKEIADYEFNGQPIMTVEQTETGASVEEYYQGEIIGRTSDKNLKKAIFQHYLNIDQLSSPLHIAWIDMLVAQGNIYAEMISDTKAMTLFFPAVFLIEIRVPVLIKKLERVKELVKKNPTINNHIMYIVLPRFEKFALITVFPDYTETLTIGMLRITAPIALAIDIAKGLSSAGIIEKEKLLRAIASPVRFDLGPFARLFSGTETDPWLF